ncbi:MAG: 3-isopropylmalate dehydrogenase [Chloroflexi bacterium]|nr:3-isopropylmalate dehydrogenase [Chloroflexota bacterium]
MNFSVAVLPGDGVGPEVVAEGVKVLEAIGAKFGHAFELGYGIVGGNAIDQCGEPLPKETLDLCLKSDAVLLGAVGGPKWDDPKAKVRPEDGLLALRKKLRLFANLRPVKVYPSLINSSPVKPSVLAGVDLIIVRELTGGLYFGRPKRRWQSSKGRAGVDTLRYSEHEIRRILNIGFQLAQGRRKRLTSVDKANVLETSRLWRQIAEEVSQDYTDVTLEHMLVDTAAMQLIRNPANFDVVVTENTFGDILTDEASVLSGSMGMLPSASLAPEPGNKGPRYPRFGLYEPIHGSAPDIATQGIANPLATILSVAMMLRLSLGLEREAQTVESAVEIALARGHRTADIADDNATALTTGQMGDTIAKILSTE